MHTLSKFVLGMMGQLRAKPATGNATTGYLPLMAAPGVMHDQRVLLSQTVGYAK